MCNSGLAQATKPEGKKPAPVPAAEKKAAPAARWSARKSSGNGGHAMFTVELRFKENGREVSFDWIVDEFAAKFAGVLKELNTARKEEGLPGAKELPHVECERLTPKAVSINEAARLLGIRPSTLRVRVKEGRIRIVRIGRRVLVPMESIDRVVREGIPGRG